MMVRRKLHPGHFCLDACYVNARGECDAINQLELWHANEVIELLFPEDAQREAEEGKNQRRTRKARSYWIPYALDNTADERALVREIAKTIFGGKPLCSGEKNDARIVFTTKKYSSILVTRDGASKTQPRGILGAAADLAKLGVTVMSDVQAVEFVRSEIAQRDRAARRLADRFGTPLPVWVGRD
jgi:hypothetical protein